MDTNDSKAGIKSLLVTFFAVAGFSSFAQKPIVTSVDKPVANNQSVVKLTGSGFGTDATKLAVFFGAAKGTTSFVSDQLLEVKVPAGATHDKISVSHLPTGLTEYSKEQFLLSFGGIHGITDSKFEGQKDFNSESGLYDLCSCDFDGDSKVDIATANDNSNSFSVFANTTSGPGLAAISYNKIPILLSTRSIHVTCGDLNGDGKPDLVLSEGGSTGDRIFILQNTSAGVGSFTFNTKSIKLVGKKVKRVKIGDLDRDGRPEIIVTNQNGNTISVLVNQSTPTNVLFPGSPLTITIPGAASTDGLAIEDLNGDQWPEIILSQFLTTTSNIFLVANSSTVGNVALGSVTTLSISQTVINLRIGDLDQDGKPDIAATQLTGSAISIFRNQSTPGSLIFSSPNPVTTEDRPWGIDFGDLDGDGKTDIVVASLTKKTLTILNNESTPGNFIFQTTLKSTTFINRHVNIGDVDSDGKPDIAYTSIDDNNNGIPASKISILRNAICLKPEITPLGPHTICVGFPLRLSSNVSAGVTYEWKNSAATVASGPNPFFDVVASGNYTVTAVAEGGTCSLTSNSIAVTVEPGTTSGPADPTNNGPICIGSTLTLSVNDVGGTQYKWTGPNGYTGTGLTPAPVTNFQAVNAGRYDLDVIVGTCVAQHVSTVVEAIAVPDFQINVGGSSIVCPPATKPLIVTPNNGAFTYQWFNSSTGIITGATGPTYNATTTGNYYVEAKYTANPSCATVQSQPVTITFVTAPIADFTFPATACVGQNVTFTNQSTSDPAAPIFYDWDFGNGNTSTDVNPVNKFLSAATFPVKLTASHVNGACAHIKTKNITVQSAPAVTITNPNNIFTFCPGDSLKLEVLGFFTSYLWSTGQTTSSIYVKTGGNYSVDVTTAACVINDNQLVDMYPAPKVIATATPSEILEGETSQLSATGLNSYFWEPGQTLSSTSIPDPIASPLVTTVYTVSGKDSNGCIGDTTVAVNIREKSATSKLKPSRFFSPDNGDEIGKFWTVERSDEFPQCRIAVYDDKGIKVYEAKPYRNDWDGTYNGRKLPDGVYYYKITCDGEENSPKTGSITLLR